MALRFYSWPRSSGTRVHWALEELGVPYQLMTLDRAKNEHRAPTDLVHRVLRDGRLVLERDRSARIAFEVRARNEYFDMQPILRRYRGQRGRAA